MHTRTVQQKKRELAEIAHRAVSGGLQSNTGGNISVRLEDENACVIKPSGVGFAECSEENLMVVSLEGKVLEGSNLKPSKDMEFHIGIYRVRPEVNGIVHVHSPWATGWACVNREVPCLTVHSRDKLRHIPIIPVGPNEGPQTAEQVVGVFRDPDVKAATFQNHGTVGVGKTLLAALHVAELIEETAHIATVRAIVQ